MKRHYCINNYDKDAVVRARRAAKRIAKLHGADEEKGLPILFRTIAIVTHDRILNKPRGIPE